jgi:hypothetical protein
MSTTDKSEAKPRLVGLSDKEAVKQILVSMVFNLWDSVTSLTRLRPNASATG